MIIWNSISIKQKTITTHFGYSFECKFRIETWWFLFVPVYRKATLLGQGE